MREVEHGEKFLAKMASQGWILRHPQNDDGALSRCQKFRHLSRPKNLLGSGGENIVAGNAESSGSGIAGAGLERMLKNYDSLRRYTRTMKLHYRLILHIGRFIGHRNFSTANGHA
jgi:hypothetical protein